MKTKPNTEKPNKKKKKKESSSYHLPVTSYQLPATRYQLPAITYQLPTTTYHLPPTTYHLGSSNIPHNFFYYYFPIPGARLDELDSPQEMEAMIYI